ncbi:MAG: J domain-containing protein [Thermoplasmatota archaeon]
MSTEDQGPTRHPLAWPTGWRRIPAPARRRAAFRSRASALTVAAALSRLTGELRRLGARDIIISTNLRLRHDGLPYSTDRAPEDVGAAVYFKLKGHNRVLACDAWTLVADNIASIAAHIDAIRRIDRYQVGTLDQAFAGYAPRLQSAPEEWRIVLGVPSNATRGAVDLAFDRLAMTAHPDRGGSHEAMARLNTARDAAYKELAQR